VAAEHDDFLARFDWQQFSDEEFALCPPVVAVGGDGAMYDIGFQNLSRAMMSGKPIKVLVVDTQVYSNTGGQACTSGFVGQISDMAQYGAAQSGKQEIRKEIGLIGLAHRSTYVMQGTIAHANHMIEGFIQGLQTRRPALFNLYTSCQPEHGIGDDMGHEQARLAVESRAYPLFRYDPDRGRTVAECIDLSGNPAKADTWPSYRLDYREGGRAQSMQVPLTFADFAMTEARFRKHFRTAPPDTWHEDMVPLAEFLELDAGEREGKYPFIWTVDRRQQLGRLLVDATMVRSTEERRDFWFLLRDLARVAGASAPAQRSEAEIERDVVARLSAGLLRLASDPGSLAALAPASLAAAAQAAAVPAAAQAPAGDAMAPWIDTPECTSCDECIRINDAIFAYDGNGKAYIKNPAGGPYADLVKAAEKCTARIIHPGLPADRSAPDIAKWIKRGEKYN
jgi:pyruvate-ferredoxin/flavodoxin oxidoreductase